MWVFLGFFGWVFYWQPCSEVWVTEGVISSLTFHPVERLLVIATYNELHFWDWSSTEPAVKVIIKYQYKYHLLKPLHLFRRLFVGTVPYYTVSFWASGIRILPSTSKKVIKCLDFYSFGTCY
jgi:hypothetical protein